MKFTKRKIKLFSLTCAITTLCSGFVLGENVQAANNKEWKFENNKWSYVDSNNLRSKDWENIKGDWFYFNSKGEMEIGWKYINKTWYHLRENGVMDTGWRKINGDWYYFNNSGSMMTGWQNINGSWYHLRENGVMDIGWRELGGAWYYLSESGAMETGWKYINNEWYHFKDSGVMSRNWDYINKEWYYFDNNGVMKVNWEKINNLWYHFENSGVMNVGWKKINNNWYYFNQNGDMAINTNKDGWAIDYSGIAKLDETPKKEEQKKPVEVKHEYNVPVITPDAGDCLMDRHLTDGLNKKYGRGMYGNYTGKAKSTMGGVYTRLMSGQMSLDQAKKELVGKYVEDGYQIKDIKMITMDVPDDEWAIYGDGSDYIEKHGGMKAFNAEKQTNFFTMWNHNGQDQRHFTRVAFLMDK
ncbi:hypothetical protein P5F35_02235 [Clostridium perfringens]|nr:hypothetical protein [Clostridium perfringens]